ncbi:adenylate kinase [Microbulbifer sp. MLAF003]|uniref:adenylate kinase n=1 Tax=unclassified Microbulbifer TaxID=2619833 RepID=UPI0024AD3DF1|nr:adenylate kinase [Microbulbifer sp. MLAF003]WHI49668.1 adenylate kinase [Microbulbifer sp. MLAF003]
MKKVAIFGKPGGGKSTLAMNLAAVTGLKYFPLDTVEYNKNGERISPEDFLGEHSELIESDNWIIDGLGTMESFWARIDAADTLIIVDLPYYIHYWWITKRLLKSCFVRPVGWPEGSSVLKGTFASWQYLRLSPRFWSDELFDKIQSLGENKKIYRIEKVDEINSFAHRFSRTDTNI